HKCREIHSRTHLGNVLQFKTDVFLQFHLAGVNPKSSNFYGCLTFPHYVMRIGYLVIFHVHPPLSGLNAHEIGVYIRQSCQ
ncbi:hypothetical protein, partial [Pseudomonas viridiflava]|uniref:hypothetical protein n=1 Tax=Pseudomonas viridiflava TaxID=33069 RepID=UPI0019804524